MVVLLKQQRCSSLLLFLIVRLQLTWQPSDYYRGGGYCNGYTTPTTGSTTALQVLHRYRHNVQTKMSTLCTHCIGDNGNHF